MKPPFCNYEIDDGLRQTADGRFIADPLAIALPCKCANSHFKDFARQLERFNPALKLGFDCAEGCYLIYRDARKVERLCDGITAVTKFPFRLKPLQWVVLRKTANGGKQFLHFPRDPGDWVFRDMAEYGPREFEFDSSWVGPKADKLAKKAEQETQKKVKEFGGQVWDDVMSVADRGNPMAIRKGVMVDKKAS